MNIAFLTETQYRGKWPANFVNSRTEICWQLALNSDHFNIHDYEQVKGYDAIFIIFPKALVKLNAVGIEMNYSNSDRDEHNIKIYSKPVVETLKKYNKIVCNIQEGPTWIFNDYDLPTQFNFYNQLAECDILFAHNEYDTYFYKGLFPGKKVGVIPSLMIPPTNNYVSLIKENKVIINGNFAKWYGGFQSYMVASNFDCPIFAPSMHCKRPGEESVPNLTHLPYMTWVEWIDHIKSYKYAVSLMPTVAAGTFSMNMAYWGVPCIGNMDVDTQKLLFPSLSVDVNDIYTANRLALQLKNNDDFYNNVSQYAIDTLTNSYHINVDTWLKYIISKL